MSLDLQLSELRRSLDVATTKIDGQLAVLLQKSDYAEQRSRENNERMIAEFAARDVLLSAHDTRMDSLERRVFFMAGIAATLGGAAGIITAIVYHGG